MKEDSKTAVKVEGSIGRENIAKVADLSAKFTAALSSVQGV